MAEQGFTLTSPAFVPGGEIPAEYTCDGEGRSPPLEWIHPPAGVKSFVLVVDDPDAPGGTFTHWVLFDIPAATRSIAAGDASIGTPARNDFQQPGYGGPCPPPNHGEHRYFFRLHALDAPSLGLAAGVERGVVEDALQRHLLGQAELMGRFERSTGAG